MTARGIASVEATELIAFDYFEQTEGNLEGKELPYPSGAKWAETNKTGANGFKVVESLEIPGGGGATFSEGAARTAVGDSSLNSGCFAQAGSTNHTTFGVSARVAALSKMPEGESRIGLLGRYVSTEKWLIAFLICPVGWKRPWLEVWKNVSGTTTQLGAAPTNLRVVKSLLQETGEISLYVAANGSWTANAWFAELSGQDNDLATGGALASGKVGIYDAYTAAEEEGAEAPPPRAIDNFQLTGADDPGVVCYSGKSVEFNHEGCLREDESGEYDGPPDEYRGAGFYLQPAGDQGLINRVVVRMRRNDVAVESAEHVTDKQTIEIKARERFLVPR